MKKTIIIATAFAFIAGFTANQAIATDKGPADITLESTIDKAKKAKPAVFPHAKHQETIACADCHHGKDGSGKQVAYSDGQAIGKCESCHNKAAGMPKKLATFKGAAHVNCKGCHKGVAKKDASKKTITKCKACHPKKK